MSPSEENCLGRGDCAHGAAAQRRPVRVRALLLRHGSEFVGAFVGQGGHGDAHLAAAARASQRYQLGGNFLLTMLCAACPSCGDFLR